MIDTFVKSLIAWHETRHLEVLLRRKQRRRLDTLELQKVLCLLFNSVGDAIMAQPAWAMLRSSSPQMVIDVVCQPSLAPLFACDPALGRVLPLAIPKGRGWNGRFIGRIRGIWDIEHYDLLIDFTEIPPTAAACAHESAPPSVGFRRVHERRGATAALLARAYDHSVPYAHNEPLRDVMVRPVSPWTGCCENRPAPVLYIPESMLIRARRILATLLNSTDRPIVLAPGAKWPPKRWPLSHWISLIQRLRSASLPFLLLGGPEDHQMLHDIHSGAPSTEAPVFISDDLLLSAALLRSSALCVCNDSAPMHLAAGVGTPSLSLFGPVSPSLSAPPESEGCRVLRQPMFCSPCVLYYSRNRCRRGTNFCLHAIRPEFVFETAQEVLFGERV